MKNVLLAILVLSAIACSETEIERELAPVQVHEWGVLTWSGDNPVLSAVPGTASHESLLPDHPITDEDGFLLRAPVLYFHGPAFSGSVTVKTDNGSIFDIYPPVPDENRNYNYCTWTADFGYEPVEEYPNFNGMAPGEWNYDLWRTNDALSISRADGWTDKFLYYETAPASTDFLPYRPGMESLCEEHMDIKALVIKNGRGGVFYSHCTLRDIVYGEDIEAKDMKSDDILRILYDWSIDVIFFEEVDALWNTWSSWVLRDHMNEPAYSNGLVMYVIPAELTEKLSTISVVPDDSHYTVDISRYLIVAMPL